jgi:phosphoesterase RecJ-like protein
MTNRAGTIAYEDQLQSAKQFIEQYNDFLVVSHIQPDGDAASSTFAVGWMLEQLGKSYVLINEGGIPSKFRYLWGSGKAVNFTEQAPNRSFRHVISVDCADFDRIGQVRSLFAPDVQLLNIDHHPTNDFFGTCHLIKPDAAATVEILFDLAAHMGLKLSVDFGECIYTGLLTDTGGFRYSSTSPKVMQVAADLLKLGVRGPELAEELLEKLTFTQIQLLQKSLATLSFACDRKIAWVSVTAEDIARLQASNEDLDGLVNYPRNVEGVEVGMLFKQKDAETVKVSFRSAGNVNVAEIAQRFGGGGHVRASGCTINGKLEEIIPCVVQEVGAALS